MIRYDPEHLFPCLWNPLRTRLDETVFFLTQMPLSSQEPVEIPSASILLDITQEQGRSSHVVVRMSTWAWLVYDASRIADESAQYLVLDIPTSRMEQTCVIHRKEFRKLLGDEGLIDEVVRLRTSGSGYSMWLETGEVRLKAHTLSYHLKEDSVSGTPQAQLKFREDDSICLTVVR